MPTTSSCSRTGAASAERMPSAAQRVEPVPRRRRNPRPRPAPPVAAADRPRRARTGLRCILSARSGLDPGRGEEDQSLGGPRGPAAAGRRSRSPSRSMAPAMIASRTASLLLVNDRAAEWADRSLSSRWRWSATRAGGRSRCVLLAAQADDAARRPRRCVGGARSAPGALAIDALRRGCAPPGRRRLSSWWVSTSAIRRSSSIEVESAWHSPTPGT